jgi:branched-chain amino acid transport system substrate-binding protein
LVAAAALTLVASTSVLSAEPAPKAQVTVGVIVDAGGSAGAYGTAQRNAVELAVDDIRNGLIDTGKSNLTFDIEDAASDPAQVVSLTQKFATDNTALLIGPTLSSEAFKSDPIAVRAGLPVLAISNTAHGIPEQGPSVFRDSLAEEQVVPEAVKSVKKILHPKTAAIIYGDDNAFTKTDFQIFQDSLTKEGIKVVDIETYHTGDVDFKPQLTKIASFSPDLLVVGSIVSEAVKIIPQAKQVGITSHIIGGNGLNSPKLIQIADKDAEGVVVGAAYDAANTYPGNAGFVTRYTKRFGTSPDQFAAQAYAGVQIVAYTVKSGATSRENIAEQMLANRGIPTVLGRFSFTQTRDADAPSAIMQVHNGTFVSFK